MGRKGMHMGFWWEDNIKTDIRETEWGGVDRIDLAQDKDHWRVIVNTVMKFRVP
jgi:hypothetical protein